MSKVTSLIIVFDENSLVNNPFISVGVSGPPSSKVTKITQTYIKKFQKLITELNKKL